MADLNDFFATDEVDDVTAAWFNALLASALRAEYRNVETLTATKTLTDADTPIQVFEPSGADRAVTLPAVATGNHPFFIVNASDTYSLLMPVGYDDIGPETSTLFVSDGVAWHVVSGGGGGGLTNSIAAVTTGNVTAVARTRHILDVSGMTANRNFVLPAGADGDEIELHLQVGDATFALIVIGDTGISINGGSPATEWSRLFITGETVRFVATSATNWQVVEDGRISCDALVERRTTVSIANNTTTKLNVDTVIRDNFAGADIVTNYRVTLRRAGNYDLSAMTSLNNMENADNLQCLIYVNGVEYFSIINWSSFSGADTTHQTQAGPKLYIGAVGDYVELYIRHNEGAAQPIQTTAGRYPWLRVRETLR